MHGLEIITRINSENRPAPHPLRMHPRIYALRQRVMGMAVQSEYISRLYAALYQYADQIIERPLYKPEDGWDDFEALQQVTLADWMAERIAQSLREF